jgi:hypothetical protein
MSDNVYYVKYYKSYVRLSVSYAPVLDFSLPCLILPIIFLKFPDPVLAKRLFKFYPLLNNLTV